MGERAERRRYEAAMRKNHAKEDERERMIREGEERREGRLCWTIGFQMLDDDWGLVVAEVEMAPVADHAGGHWIEVRLVVEYEERHIASILVDRWWDGDRRPSSDTD